MKRAKQVHESKQLIYQGFMGLLKTKAFDEINMSDIAKAAGLARMTLYRHFKEKEDIIIYGFEENLKAVMDLVNKKDQADLRDLLVFRFTVLKSSPYTKILAKHDKLDKLYQTFGRQFAYHFDSLLPVIEDDFIQTFIGGGIDAMTSLWIKGGMIESAMVMADKSLTIIRKIDLLE